MRNANRTTIKCIAEEVGLSVTTVSRVLNGKGRAFRIGRATEQRVLEAADRLNFSPNLMARGLRLKSSQSIGLVVPDIANPFFARIASSISAISRRRGYSMLLCDSHDETETEISEIQLLQDRAVDGLILCPVGISSDHIRQFENASTPIVVLDRYFPKLRLPAVSCDNASSARMAVEHLLAYGHRRIGCLSGLAGTLSNEERINGYRQALEAYGIPCDEQLISGDGFTRTSGYKATRKLLRQPNRVTALFASSNQCALGALQAISEAGLDVPNDISMVTFDEIEGAEFMSTPITVVDQPATELGTKAAEKLFDQITQQTPFDPRPVLLPAKLVARASVKDLAHQ